MPGACHFDHSHSLAHHVEQMGFPIPFFFMQENVCSTLSISIWMFGMLAVTPEKAPAQNAMWSAWIQPLAVVY